MSSNALISLVVFVATALWCYAAVLALEWFGTLRRAPHNDKVGHVVSLLGALVPAVVLYILVVLVGGVVGLPSVVVFLALIVPGGLVFGLRIALADEGPVTSRQERQRALWSAALLALVIAYRQVGG